MKADLEARPELPSTMPMFMRIEPCEFARETRAEGDATADNPTPAASDKPRRYRVILTSETSRRTWAGVETLLHEPSAIDMSLAKNGLSAYLEHGGPDLSNPDPNLHVGIVEDIELNTSARRLEGWLRFSRHEVAQRTENDVQDGTRRYMSGSYIPVAVKETKPWGPKGEPREYTVTKWRPVEAGVVGIPADPKALIKRSEGGVEFPVEIEPATQPEVQAMSEVTNPTQPTPASPASEPAGAGERAVRSAAGSPGAVAAVERDAAAKMIEFCNAHGAVDRAPEFMRRGLTIDEAGREILEARGRSASPAPTPPASMEDLGMSKREARKYSYARALKMALEVRENRRQKLDGLEGEVHQTINDNLPANVQRRGGVLVPLRLQNEFDDAPAGRETRALGTGVATGGAELVYDRPGEFIELLRNRALVMQFGATMLTGLTAPVPFPKLTSDPAVRWMAENPASPATGSQPTFGVAMASPKTLIGSVPIPRQLLMLAISDIEGIVRQTLAGSHGLAWDRGALHGAGVNGEPLGIYKTPGVKTVTFSSAPPTHALLCDMENAVEDGNANAATMAYITTPGIKAKAKKTQVFTSTNGVPLWQGGLVGELDGIKAGATNQVSKTMSSLEPTGGSQHGIILGAWEYLYMCFWGALELQTDPITLADYGQVKVTTFQMGDVVNVHPEAFCVSDGATLA